MPRGGHDLTSGGISRLKMPLKMNEWVQVHRNIRETHAFRFASLSQDIIRGRPLCTLCPHGSGCFGSCSSTGFRANLGSL